MKKLIIVISGYLNNLNITRLAWLGAMLLVLAIVVNASIGLKNIKKLAEIQSNLQNTGEVMLVIDSLHIDILNAETGQRGYLLFRDESHLAPYVKALDKFALSLENVQQSRSQSEAQQGRIDAFTLLAQAKLKKLKASIDVAVGFGANIAQQQLKEIDEEQINFRHLYSTIIQAETQTRENLLKRLDETRTKAGSNVIWFTALSVFMCATMMILLMKHIHSIRSTKEKLEQYNATLEARVIERTHALEVYTEELNRSNRELEDFAFVASHDLQEPLRKIRAFGDRLTSNFSAELGDKGADYLARMNAAAKRMSVLISDLLELSRVTTKGKPFQEVDLNELLLRVLDDLEIATQESGANIELSDLPKIQADGSQLGQLFLNLISNAIKFRKPGQQPHIVIRGELVSSPEYCVVATDTQWIKIEILDNGIGFSEQYNEKIFTPFQRLHSQKDYAGTGIGLAVCRRIVERHSGYISADSPEGEGAIFTLLLPIDANLFTVEDGKVELLKTPSH
ncbi:sensor histidine kinase [Colwellia asteriadis]